ncbi:hypothetical protein FKW77_005277 [Venturia effusa]|uniref:Tyrosine--tRNA ligase n=1 Tax=Venturia effusa TaxID=50376 RepID=A0A517KZG5_9PEZI|nr:hypothetical protein FKW77_005277 [Venturia effusa]
MLEILEERGFVNQIVGTRDELNNLMMRKRVGAYVGIDPTASSMHVGHLIPFMALFWMYLYGYPAVTLLGGATAGVGDPTGRSTARIQHTRHVRTVNTRYINAQIQELWKNVAVLAEKHLIDIPGDIQREKQVLNNDDWLSKISIMGVLEIIGSGLRLGPLLGRDTVKTRMESSDGMSFSEFCYPVLQAWDWWHMFRQHRIQLQIGGADQYGNILSGMDAIKYAGKAAAPNAGQELSSDSMPMGFTVPLLTTPSGEKFGKSAGNAVWLDEDQTSVFDLYGFFVSQPDADVERLLKFFTFLPLATIQQTMEEHVQSPEKRIAQHRLAREFVELVHGAEEAETVEKQHRFLFAPSPLRRDDVLKGEPDVVLPASMVVGFPFSFALKRACLSKTKSQAARLIKSGGGYLLTASPNEGLEEELSFVPIVSLQGHLVTQEHLISTPDSKWPRMVLRSGKRKITGANGHLGFRVVVTALAAGYKVRAIVRRVKASEQIKAAKSIHPHLDGLEIVVVEDLLGEGVFDEALKGMDAVIHVASPITKQTDKYIEEIVEPARLMTMSLLRSAAKVDTIKRVVITSSVVVLDIGKQKSLNARDLGPVPELEDINSWTEAYRGSKRIARAESMAWLSKTKPGFDIINILPSVILGYNELTTSITAMLSSGTNRLVASIISGIPATPNSIGATVHLDDCAKIHIQALDPSIPGNRDYLAHATKINWSDDSVANIARQHFPDEVKSGVLPLNGGFPNTDIDFDSSETERVFGIRWMGVKEQVKSVIRQYVDLAGAVSTK